MRYQFFKKPESSKLSILKSSALSENKKSATGTQEVVRRLSNTGISESQDVKDKILEEYFDQLRRSGYEEKEIKRFEVNGIIGFERRVKREQEGGEAVHRDKTQIQKGTFKKKLTIKKTWYKGKKKGEKVMKIWGMKKIVRNHQGCLNSPPSAPIFVPRTSGGGGLVRRLREIEKKLNRVGDRRVKVVEEVGKTIQDILVKSNPLGEATCEAGDCQVCTFADSRGKCRSKSVVYSSTCTLCENQGLNVMYFGETNANCYIRAKQHLRDADEKVSSSHMYNHSQLAHPEV